MNDVVQDRADSRRVSLNHLLKVEQKSALKNWVRYQEEFYKYYSEILSTANITVKK